MIILKSFIFIFFISYYVNFLGFLFEKFFKKINFVIRSVVGFSFLIIFINFLYFGLNISMPNVRYVLIFLIIFAHFFFFKKSFIVDFLKSLRPSLLIIIFYLALAFFYGEQFYIFRGNHYDAINYTGMSLISSIYSFDEIVTLLKLKTITQTPYLLDFANIFLTDRPLVSVFIGIFYLPNFIDLYLANYLLKIFFISLIPSSVTFFFQQSKLAISKFKIFLISQIFTFSFFIFYIAEIDAYSQLSVVAISLVFVSLIVFNLKIYNFDIKFFFYILITAASFLLLYAEQALVYFFFILIVIIFNNIKNYKKVKFFYIFFFIIFFLFLTSPGQFYVYNFLLNQINLVRHSTNDWWGYYGAYILGANNIILNEEYVLEIKRYFSNYGFFETIKYIHILNVKDFGSFYLLNIFPSFFGIYYINGLNFLNIYIVYTLNIIISFSIFYFILFNLKIIFLKKKLFFKFYKTLIFFILFFLILFLLNSKYWIAIKLFFYFSFFIFVLIVLKIEKKIVKLNYLLIFFIILFPLYKFSNFNYGIGNHDSFPSVLKKDFKIEHNLVISKETIKNCQNINIIRKNSILDMFFATKLIYYNVNFNFIDKGGKNKCQI